MAFRAVKADTYNSVRSRATTFKKLATDTKNLMAAGNVSASVIRQLLEACLAAKTEFTAAASVSGIVAYVQAQEGDPTYNVATEFNAMLSAIDGIIDEIVSIVPTGTGGYVLMEKWEASGVSSRQVTPAQTATLRDRLDTFIASVE